MSKTEIEYTLSERTQRNYTVGDAIAAARTYLTENGHVVKDVTGSSNPNRKITLVELNEISDLIIQMH